MRKAGIVLFLCVLLLLNCACKDRKRSDSELIPSSSAPDTSSESIDSSTPETVVQSNIPKVSVSTSADTNKKTVAPAVDVNTVSSAVIKNLQTQVQKNPAASVVLPKTRIESPVFTYDENGYAYTYDDYGNKKIVYHQVNGQLDTYKIYYYADLEKAIIEKVVTFLSDNSINSIEYYKNKKVTKLERFENGLINSIFTYDYDDNGNQTLNQQTDANGNIINKVINKYDTFGNVIKTFNYATDDTISGIQEFSYDEDGNFLEYHEYDGNGILIF